MDIVPLWGDVTTASIPIVFVTVANPVRLGFVESFPRPGGNITSFQSLAQGGFGGKQLELFKAAVPPRPMRSYSL